MSSVAGKVISVSLNTTVEKQDKSGTYPAWEIVFRGGDGKVSTIQKHVNGLKFNPDLKAALEDLKEGDDFLCVMEKKGAFNEVKSITKGEYPMEVAAKPSDAPRSGKVTGSNYETPVERAARQRLIVRQSSLSNAIEYFNAFKIKHTDVKEVLDLADRFTDFVFENNKQEEVE